MLPIQKKLVKYNYSSSNNIQYIVIHDTGNTGRGANANAHYNYFNGGDRQSSAHYFVDSNNIIQIIEDWNASWHCGDGGGRYGIGNHNSIGIEICINSDGNYNKAITNTIDLVKYKMKQYGIPVSKIVRHYDASRKNCPASMSSNGWEKWNWFKSQLGGNISNSNSSTSKPTAVVTASALNVREKKSTSSKILGVLQNGKSVEVYRVESDWVHIYYPPHGGFISKQYVKLYNIPNSIIQKTTSTPQQIKNVYRIRKSWTDIKSQIGAYSILDNAIDECKKHNGFNVYDDKGNVVFPKIKPTEVKIEDKKSSVPKTPIMGESILTKQQMIQYLLENNDNPKINTSISELVELFLNEGKIEGVRGDIAFCQAVKETGFFNFGGDMLPTQNNFCGLGTTGEGVKGAIFKTPQDGIKAQIQHLKAYASKDELVSECIDPRFNLIERGIAPNWEDLSERWAIGNNYGQEIIQIYEKIKLEEVKIKKISIIVYYGLVDEYGAKLLKDIIKLPIMSLDDFKANPSLKECVDKLYMIGGQEKPIDNTILISGNDKIQTAQAVIDYIKKLK